MKDRESAAKNGITVGEDREPLSSAASRLGVPTSLLKGLVRQGHVRGYKARRHAKSGGPSHVWVVASADIDTLARKINATA